MACKARIVHDVDDGVVPDVSRDLAAVQKSDRTLADDGDPLDSHGSSLIP